MPDKTARTYRVANPNGIAAGTRVLLTTHGSEPREWFEGDEITAKDAKDAKDFADLIALGYVVEVSDAG